MTEIPLFTVITVCLDSEKHIAQTVESLLRQNRRDLEYILIDGGSTDSTLGVIEQFRPSFEGALRVVSSKDNGIYDAMNKGLKLAAGELILFLNSDDYLAPGALDRVSEEYARSKADIIYGDIGIVLAMGGRLVTIRSRADHTVIKEEMGIKHPAAFVKRSVYEKLGGYDATLRRTADYDLFYRFAQANLSYHHVTDVLAFFRTSGSTFRNRIQGFKEDRIVRLRYLPRWQAEVLFLNAVASYYVGILKETVLTVFVGRDRLARWRYERWQALGMTIRQTVP